MSHPDQPWQTFGRTLASLAPGAIYLLIAGGIAGLAALMVADRMLAWTLAGVAGALLGLGLSTRLSQLLLRRRQARMLQMIAAFVEHDAAPSFSTDADGAIVYQNSAATERFGPRNAQSLTRALAELFANPGAVLARLQGLSAGRGAAREDLVTRRGHVRLSVHRVGTDHFLWRLEDMADHLGADSAGSISLPVMTVTKAGKILAMNEPLRRILGERVRSLDRIFGELPIRSGEAYEIATTSGPLQTMVIRVEIGGGRCELYLLPMLGERAAAQDPAAFETLPVALLRLNGEGRILLANHGARQLLGKVPLRATMSDLFEGLGRPINDWVADALAGRADRRPEVMRVRGSEGEVFLQITLSRLVDNGRSGLIAVLSDATQLKTLEAQFVQSQKMQAIGQLAGGVAHDFNNLLTAISGHCDLLMLRHDKADPDYADLDQISQNANRAAALVRQLLAFSRKQTLKLQVVDLRDVLSDLTHLLNRLVGEKVLLRLGHGADLQAVRADKRQLEQVIMNLVVNARDAMPEGGEIRIETENVVLSDDLKRDRATVPRGSYVTIKVIDAGKGISPDQMSKIFEPFFTTKRTGEGTGLGLSTAYGIVKQTGGYIFCDSVLGHGSSFTIYLPSYDRLVEPHLVAQEAPPGAGPLSADRSATVLLVEDEAPVRAFAARALKLRGYTVYEAESAEQALDILKDESLVIDVFVTDVIMPGMDGPTWVAQALQARPGTAVVFMSGYAEEVFRDGKPALENSTFLPKPFSLSELTARVQNQLGAMPEQAREAG